MINIVIMMHRGEIEDVQVFQKSNDALECFKKYTGCCWREPLDIYEDFKGSEIWELSKYNDKES